MRGMRYVLPILLLAAAASVHAQTIPARLQVSAQVVISCRLDVSVPRVGSGGRASGAANVGVSCTKGASAVAAQCTAPCAPLPGGDLRREYQVAESRMDGSTVATLLF